jgi:hypothetical protein
MFDCPVFVLALTVTVIVELAGLPGETDIVAGLKLAVPPPGKPLALSVTLPTNPLEALTVRVVFADGLVERLTVTFVGFAVTETEPPNFTVSVKAAEWVRLPLVPVT